MSIALGLFAAVAFGACDFFAGLASRWMHPAVVAVSSQSMALITAIVAVLIFPGDGPTAHAVIWGALGGVASGSGALALYHGLSVGRMSVVATLSGLMTAVIPVLFGLAAGDTLSIASAVGIVLAIPAIGLVSWHPGAGEGHGQAGALWGFVAGIGFGLLFIALDQAGTESGAWPLVGNQSSSVLVALPVALFAFRRGSVVVTRHGVYLTAVAGVLIGLASLAFLAATHSGELAIVVVLTALYPGFTAILARIFLPERWIRTQQVGLVAALIAVILVSAGSA